MNDVISISDVSVDLKNDYDFFTNLFFELEKKNSKSLLSSNRGSERLDELIHKNPLNLEKILDEAGDVLVKDKKFIILLISKGYSLSALWYRMRKFYGNDRSFFLSICKAGFYHAEDIVVNEDLGCNIEKFFDLWPKTETTNLSKSEEVWISVLKRCLEVDPNKFDLPPSFEDLEDFLQDITNEEEKDVNDRREILEKESITGLKFFRLLGRGAYGSTYLCEFDGIDGLYVAKIYNDPLVGIRKRTEQLKRDCLYLPYHENVVSILTHREMININTSLLPDYENNWSKFPNEVSFGLIVMKYYYLDLGAFRKKRLKLARDDEDMGKFNFKEVCSIFGGILSGCYHLHKNMIVHRDLHPGNIFVHPEKGRVWVGDFGCALDLRNNSGGWRVHKNHVGLMSFCSLYSSQMYLNKGGMISYLAPEISTFDDEKDTHFEFEKCDIYSIGVLLDGK